MKQATIKSENENIINSPWFQNAFNFAFPIALIFFITNLGLIILKWIVQFLNQ